MQPTSESPYNQNPKNRGLLVGLAAAAIAIVAVLAFVTGRDASTNVSAGSSTGGSTGSIYDFPLARPDGTTTTLAQYQGRPMVVNYFAAWCPPCRRELPDFEAVHRAIGDEVAIVGVSRDNTTSAWLSLVDSVGLTYDTFFEGSVVGSFEFVNGLAMPTTVFINADGEIQRTFSGALDEASLTALINETLLSTETEG